jgi:acetoin utilization deacetylase AcuC-like enzyme
VTTLVISHAAGLGHDTGPGHPERPERLRAVEQVLSHEAFKPLNRQQAPAGDRQAILRVHPGDYVAAVEKSAPASGYVHADPDTVMSKGTMEALMHGVGGAVLGVDSVMRGEADNAFVAIRPPGHHAERATPMGFCFYNFAAIAVRQAQAVYGAERVAVVDFDVHHGNGTQDIFWADETVMYGSTHQMPLFPGTGSVSERGEHENIVNAPLAPGDDGDHFREAFETVILPRVEAFRPDLIIISAGFDAHRLDPLANVNLVETDFAWVTAKLMELADTHCKGRIVSILEGGYNLEGLSRSVAAHVLTLMGKTAEQ